MNKNTRYAIFYDSDNKETWFTYPNRKSALKAVERGEYEPGTSRQVNFTGAILTPRQMRRQGLL